MSRLTPEEINKAYETVKHTDPNGRVKVDRAIADAQYDNDMNRPELSKELEDILDELMAMLTVVILDCDEAKVAALKDANPVRVEAIFALREKAKKQIIALFRGEG